MCDLTRFVTPSHITPLSCSEHDNGVMCEGVTKRLDHLAAAKRKTEYVPQLELRLQKKISKALPFLDPLPFRIHLHARIPLTPLKSLPAVAMI